MRYAKLPLFALLPLLAFLPPGLKAQAAEVTIRIDKYAFLPPVAAVKPGDSVVWLNAEKRTSHDIAFPDGVVSERLMPGDSYTRIFPAPGRYPYYCAAHPQMTGEVVVEPPGAPLEDPR